MKTQSSIARPFVLILATMLIGFGMQQITAIAQFLTTVFSEAGSYAVFEPADSPPIYWIEYDSRELPHKAKIQRLDGTNLQDIISGFAPGTFVNLLAVDVEDSKIYYKTQKNITNKFYRANLDGSNIQHISDENIQSVAVYGGRIYWTHYGGNQIHTVNQNLSDRRRIDAGPDVGVIAIDTQGAKIYWDVGDTENPSHLDHRNFKRKIQRANLDGSNIQDIVTGLDLPGTIAVDGQGGKIYWSERIMDKIQRANLDGSNIQDIYTFPPDTSTSISLDVQGGKIYWTDWTWTERSNIKRANLDGSNMETIIRAGGHRAKFSGYNVHVIPMLTTLPRQSKPVSTPEPVPTPEPLPQLPEPVEPVPLPEPSEVVSIPDTNLALLVRDALGLAPNASITKSGLQKLNILRYRTGQGGVITNLTGLEHATKLVQLSLWDNQIQDVSPLAELTQLQWLRLQNNQITDITPLATLTQLRQLHLWGNQIRDIRSLRGLTKLESLWLENNQIRDISPLAGLTQLTDLKLNGNPIQDMSPLRTLLNQNPKLKLDIEIPPLSPVIHLEAAQRPPIYWVGATTGTLHRLVGDEVENLVSNVKNATGLAIDVAGGKLYWTEKTGERTGRIRRANLGGTNVRLVKNLTSVPDSIALDTVNGKLYLTNAWGKIQCLNVDGSNFQPNLITNLDTPRNLVLDVTGGKVYWTETTEASGRIRRANLDGSSVQNVARGLVPSLSLAVANGKIYWTEGTTENAGKLHRANLNGTNSKMLETLPLASTGIAVDTGRNSLYLTARSGEIHRRDLDGSGEEPVVTGLVAPSNIVLGITTTTPDPTDPTETPATPVVDAATDVNQDQKVNKTDLLLVVTALGENPPANPNFDVNADGAVNIADVLLVIEDLDDPVAAAAPSLGGTMVSFDPAFLTAQIDLLRAESDGSLKYAHAIAFFQGLLASIRPTETQLLANYPNPFNPETWIPYQLAMESDVRITIYNAQGSVVRVLVLGHQPVGFYTGRSRAAYWDGRNTLGEQVASGVYFYQLETDTMSSTRKMVILK